MLPGKICRDSFLKDVVHELDHEKMVQLYKRKSLEEEIAQIKAQSQMIFKKYMVCLNDVEDKTNIANPN